LERVEQIHSIWMASGGIAMRRSATQCLSCKRWVGNIPIGVRDKSRRSRVTSALSK
jgi:hypothetical protein